MLIFQIKRIISNEKWFKYVVTFFFFENAKNLGRSDDAKRRKKKGMALIAANEHLFHLLIKSWFKYSLEAKAT